MNLIPKWALVVAIGILAVCLVGCTVTWLLVQLFAPEAPVATAVNAAVETAAAQATEKVGGFYAGQTVAAIETQTSLDMGTPAASPTPVATATPAFSPTPLPSPTPAASPTPYPTYTPLPTYTPPAAPVAAPAQPAAPANSGLVRLAYDNKTPDCMSVVNSQANPWISNQTAYVAYFLCQAINGKTEQAMFDAAKKLQIMAEVTGAKVWIADQNNSITIPVGEAAAVWCSNTTGLSAPNDTSFPLGQEPSTKDNEYDSPNGLGNVIVIHEIGGGSTGRTFTSTTGACQLWAVAVH